MSDPSPEDLEREFGPLIAAELAELRDLRAASKGDRSPIELDQQSVGRVSRIDSIQVQAMSNAAETRRHTRERSLEAAFSRLGSDAFGHCAECGMFIGLARLKIDPAAFRCIDCAP